MFIIIYRNYPYNLEKTKIYAPSFAIYTAFSSGSLIDIHPFAAFCHVAITLSLEVAEVACFGKAIELYGFCEPF